MISRMRNASGCRDLHRMKVIYPERLRERRYVTLKSAGIAGLGLVVAFLLLSVWSAYRPHSAASDNSIFSRVQTFDSTSTRPDTMVVNEGWINDHPGTDSLLLDAEAVDQQRAAAFAAQAPSTEETNFEHRTSQLGKGQRITISGGSEAVQLHAEPMPAAVPAPQSPGPQPPR